MRGCWCGSPNIYNSREEAELATGHLRFYVVGSETKNLRVLQKKDDFRWHCCCGNDEYYAVYKDLISNNGKRPAEDSELDLILHDQDSDHSKSVERVVPALIELTRDEEGHWSAPEPTQEETLAPAPSMWSQARDIFSRAVATMTGPVVTLLGKLREQLCASAYQIIDVRHQNGENGNIVVKRVKRQAAGLPADRPLPDDENSGLDDLVWTDDPTKRIGYEKLAALANAFVLQLESVKAGNVIGGSSIDDIKLQIQSGQDLGTSIIIHVLHESRYGPPSPEESDDEKAKKMLDTLEEYQTLLSQAIAFMQEIYNSDTLDLLKARYPSPPRQFAFGKSSRRQALSKLGRFLCLLRSLNDVFPLNPEMLETICNMIVDVNAVYKQEMLPSWVELKGNPTEGMPGLFPEEKVPVMEEVKADELFIEPVWDSRFSKEEPSDAEQLQSQPGDYKLVSKPKGILKPSKAWDIPTSPRYVATPEKKRKLAFKNPVSKFIAPAHIPARVMTPHEAERIVAAKLRAEAVGDEHSVRMLEASSTVSRHRDLTFLFEDKWSLEAIKRDDKEMGLVYHARKYDGFLNELQDDLEKRAQEQQEIRNEPSLNLTPRKRMVQIPLPPLPATPEYRKRRIAQFAWNNSSSPAVSSPEVNPLMRAKAEEMPPKPIQKKREAKSLEDFFAQDDEEENLEISIAKLQQLQIDKQIEDEFKAGCERDLQEKRKRRAEEERRRQEEERRRQQQQRQREQEARRQREALEFAALTGLRQPARPLITPLSADWELRVGNAAKANPTAELVKTLEGQPLTRRDFEEKLLPPTAWLNDNVIIGSILHVAESVNTANGGTSQEPKCAAFTSYFWPRLESHGPGGCGRLLRRAGVRKANLLDIDTILIPICAQSHWTLAVIRPGRRTVSHIDSMRGGRGDPRVKNKLLELVRFILEDQFVEAEWTAVDYEAPRQTNGWDCGVFTITNAMCMALGINPKFAYTERELTLQRRRLAAVLLNEGFKGEFSLDGF
ncbi:hypothetical protein VTI74DRAFT_1145 [Chaetomium olivicolor]